METKINTRKRIRIFREVLVKIWNEQEQNPHPHRWFSGFIRSFSAECGLLHTSILGNNSALYGGRRVKETYLFKILDKQKWMLSKIKYGI